MITNCEELFNNYLEKRNTRWLSEEGHIKFKEQLNEANDLKSLVSILDTMN